MSLPSSRTDRKVKEKKDHPYVLHGCVFLVGISFFYLIYFYIKKDSTEKPSDIIESISSCAVAFVIFYTYLSYIFIYSKSKEETKNAKDLLTFTTANEFFKPSMNKYMMICNKYQSHTEKFIENKDFKKLHKFLENKDNLLYKTALFTVFNYFESIALGVKQNLINERFIKGFFSDIFISYNEEYIFYIKYRRIIKKNRNMWKNFTNLANKWNEEKEFFLEKAYAS